MVFGIQQDAFVPIVQHIRPGMPVRPPAGSERCRRTMLLLSKASPGLLCPVGCTGCECALGLPPRSTRGRCCLPGVPPRSTRGCCCLPGFPHLDGRLVTMWKPAGVPAGRHEAGAAGALPGNLVRQHEPGPPRVGEARPQVALPCAGPSLQDFPLPRRHLHCENLFCKTSLHLNLLRLFHGTLLLPVEHCWPARFPWPCVA